MTQLAHLLKHDFLLLQRYKVVPISIAVTLVYVAVFRMLAPLGDMERLMVLVIFNDPALLGFLFVGVMHLFENNENTLQALAVTPMRVSNYILSKSVSLSVISLFCCFFMVLAGYGKGFNLVHFSMASILSTMIFSMIGFLAVAGQKSFNTYLLRALGIILLLIAPFLGYFKVLPESWFWIFPTQPAIGLFSLAFQQEPSIMDIVVPYSLCAVWLYVMFRWATYTITQKITQL